MKGIGHLLYSISKIIFSLSLVCSAALCVNAQSAGNAENLEARITRARALAAVGNLPAARSELESLLRAEGGDESEREIALVLLVGVYLDQADYTYASALVNDSFKARTVEKESGTHAYYALAGQVINSVRVRLERYRAFGLNVSDNRLPPEAVNDLEHLRAMIENIVTQGKTLRDENGKSFDAAALLEDASNVRMRLARNDAERAQWQREVADARQRLVGSDTRIGSLGVVANARPQPVSPPASTTSTPAQAIRTTSTPVTTATPPPSTSNSTTPAAGASTSTANAPTSTSSPNSSAQNHADTNSPVKEPLEIGAALITKAKDQVAPTYPQTARQAHVTGKVTVYLIVDEKGEVASIERTDGPQLLRRAAEDAARHWKFRPTVVNGQPVRVTGYISFNFAL